uniref:Fibronectin type-III domain-containing protein n=1 Tax=Sphaeramia orbicularis TaxID=375764 RepID=A0A673ASD4_9TELE
MTVCTRVSGAPMRKTQRSTFTFAIKYEEPQNILVSWLKNNLYLRWKAPENHPPSAEVWFQQDLKKSWEKLQINATLNSSLCQVAVTNLQKNSVYRVQIRHRSTTAKNALWSDWSSLTVPAELEHKPNVNWTVKLVNGTRKVKLSWEPPPHASAVGGVTYILTDTQSLHGCPCRKKRQQTNTNNTKYTLSVSYSAANISITARNKAGSSPPTVIQLKPEPGHDVQPCNLTKILSKACHEWFEMHNGDVSPESLSLTPKSRKERKDQIKALMKDYVRYLYIEHRCVNGMPQTVKTCYFYHKEDAPDRPPEDFSTFGETHNSIDLSWKGIPSDHQRGFLKYYRLCSVRVSSQEEKTECCNISVSLSKYRLENLSPGSKYNLSLCGVTAVGEGPKATATITTLPEMHTNVWLSLGLLLIFFFISTTCTFILKRIKSRIFPPVPTPVIPDFISSQPECQAMMDRKEEVHELTLFQLHPDSKPVPEDAEESTVLRGGWDNGSDEDQEGESRDRRTSEGDGDECLSSDSTERTLTRSKQTAMADLERVENDIAMLIYKNGLVFDVKADST